MIDRSKQSFSTSRQGLQNDRNSRENGPVNKKAFNVGGTRASREMDDIICGFSFKKKKDATEDEPDFVLFLGWRYRFRTLLLVSLTCQTRPRLTTRVSPPGGCIEVARTEISRLCGVR